MNCMIFLRNNLLECDNYESKMKLVKEDKFIFINVIKRVICSFKVLYINIQMGCF